MQFKIIAAIAAVLMVLLSGAVIPTGTASAATPAQSSNDQITTESGPTTDLGGGDHFYVKFGSDAAFGLVWGNETNPNNIYFVSYVSRTLGYINVDQPNGTVVSQNPVKIYTLYAVKLDSLIEYNDINNDGVLAYSPAGIFANLLTGQIYKGVDLSAASWTTSDWSNETLANGTQTWSFTLTATNLHYSVPFRYMGDDQGDGVLNSISLTFHLTANTNYVSGVSVPQWSVTMGNNIFGMPRFENLSRSDDLTVSGNVTNYNVKWDKNITGWDFNSRDQNPALLTEYSAIVANYVPDGVKRLMAVSEYQRMLGNMGDNGTMTADGQTMDGTYSLSAALSLHTPKLTFGGETSRIGAFEWVQDVTVDNETKNATAQVTALMPFNIYFGGVNLYGFVAVVGISYPGGQSIVQDPIITSQAMTDVAMSTGDQAGSPAHFPIGLVLLGVAVVLVVGAVIWSRKGGRSGPVNYEKLDQQPPQDDWSTYYEKK